MKVKLYNVVSMSEGYIDELLHFTDKEDALEKIEELHESDLQNIKDNDYDFPEGDYYEPGDDCYTLRFYIGDEEYMYRSEIVETELEVNVINA